MASAKGKTVIVTGGSGGLGKAIAAAFLGAGANMVVCDVHKARLATVQTEWDTAYPERALAQETDVTDEAAVQALVDAAAARFGRVDVLVNNAAVMDDFSPVGTLSKTVWDRVLAANLTGPFLATKAAVNQMLKQEPAGGSIISIGSNASWQGYCAGAAYTVSKAGVMALTKNTAGAYGARGVNSMCLLLGPMMGTNFMDGVMEGINMENLQQVMSSHRPFDAEKNAVPVESVAKYVLFLTDAGIADSTNGSCVVFNKNWPAA